MNDLQTKQSIVTALHGFAAKPLATAGASLFECLGYLLDLLDLSHIGRFRNPHPVGQIREFKKPDTQIRRPKTELIKLFQRELGNTRKYVDRDHALLLAQSIPDWSKLRRSDSFRRFAEKGARVSLP